MPPTQFQREHFGGIYAAILTPLTPDERLDESAFEAFCHTLLDEGQQGLYVTGGTGEAYSIDDTVREKAFRIAARLARSRNRNERIIAHVGGVQTRRACAMATSAAAAGCDAVAAIPPYGGRYTFEELTDYYTALAKATPLPVIVYHVPHANGYDFPRERLSRWLELPNVIGIKFTSHDLFKFERLVTLHPNKVFFSGSDEVLASAVQIGAMGAIGLCYNLVGPLALKIFAAVTRGDMATALAGQSALNAFVEAYFNANSFQAFKMAAAQRNGWSSGRSPAPAAAASLDAITSIITATEAALRVARELK